MTTTRTLTIALFALILGVAPVLGVAPAWADRMSETGVTSDHQQSLKQSENSPAPYAMSYSEQAAQSLGFKDGQWEAFDASATNPLALKGGIDKGGPMLRLQWKPGV